MGVILGVGELGARRRSVSAILVLDRGRRGNPVFVIIKANALYA